jgi:hypothetical protein
LLHIGLSCQVTSGLLENNKMQGKYSLLENNRMHGE